MNLLIESEIAKRGLPVQIFEAGSSVYQLYSIHPVPHNPLVKSALHISPKALDWVICRCVEWTLIMQMSFVIEDFHLQIVPVVCCSAEVNLNYNRLFMDVKKQYLKLLGALVSDGNVNAYESNTYQLLLI